MSMLTNVTDHFYINHGTLQFDSFSNRITIFCCASRFYVSCSPVSTQQYGLLRFKDLSSRLRASFCSIPGNEPPPLPRSESATVSPAFDSDWDRGTEDCRA